MPVATFVILLVFVLDPAGAREVGGLTLASAG